MKEKDLSIFPLPLSSICHLLHTAAGCFGLILTRDPTGAAEGKGVIPSFTAHLRIVHVVLFSHSATTLQRPTIGPFFRQNRPIMSTLWHKSLFMEYLNMNDTCQYRVCTKHYLEQTSSCWAVLASYIIFTLGPKSLNLLLFLGVLIGDGG